MTGLGVAAIGAVATKSLTLSKIAMPGIGSPTRSSRVKAMVLAQIRRAQAKGLPTCSIEFAEQELSKGYLTAPEYIKAKWGIYPTPDQVALFRKNLFPKLKLISKPSFA